MYQISMVKQKSLLMYKPYVISCVNIHISCIVSWHIVCFIPSPFFPSMISLLC
uniref:Uncharacterized protein n=1 Tax=Rhizophora mucronata TaxID=61149 RepID=A0A2P2N6Y1_RHIMU